MASVVIPQAPSINQATITTSGAYTASDTYGPWPVDFWTSAEITTVVTVASGSLDVYLQKLLPDNVLYDDIAHLATFTTTGAVTISFVNGGNTLNGYTNAGLAANTIQTVAFGSYWRVRTVITGTSPTFNFGIFGNFRS